MTRRSPLLEPTILVGVVVSIVVTVAAYFLSGDKDPKLLSLVVGLLVVSISLMLEVLFRFARQSELERQITRVRWLAPLIQAVTDGANEIEHRSRLEPLRDRARGLVTDCAESLQEIAKGRYRAPTGEGVVWESTDKASHVLRAVSVQSLDLAGWYSTAGDKHWQAMLRALARGVTIERVFVYNDWDEVHSLITKQAEAGIQTYAIPMSNVPDDLQVDMGVWDDRFTYSREMNSQGIEIAGLYSVNEADISRRIRQFERLKAMASRTEGTSMPV